MAEQQILFIVLIALTILAIIFLVTGILLLRKANRIKNHTTEHVIGKVVRYSFSNSLAPVVEYEVNGEKYRKALKYSMVISTRSSFGPVKSQVKGDLLDTKLRIRGNSRVSVNTIMREAFPIGDHMNVYYNPDGPKESYVDRYAHTYTGHIFLFAAIFIILIVFLLAYLIN